MTEPYIHWSDRRLTVSDLVSRRQHDKAHLNMVGKPVGLWFSAGDDDDGWRSWCESEGFRLEQLVYQNRIVFKPDAKLLRIGSVAELDLFNDTFSEGVSDLPPKYKYTSINWARVEDYHQGIIIAPYCWERRLEYMWYYGWDCASGCVWDVSCIERILAFKPGRFERRRQTSGIVG